jgi:hypothetical protein
MSTAMIMKQIKKTMEKTNVYSPKSYFQDDWFIVVITYCSIFMSLIGLYYLPDSLFKNQWAQVLTIAGFGTIGFNANHIASAFFSVATKRILDAIDYKTTEFDKANGTLDQPTPAILPKDSK